MCVPSATYLARVSGESLNSLQQLWELVWCKELQFRSCTWAWHVKKLEMGNQLCPWHHGCIRKGPGARVLRVVSGPARDPTREQGTLRKAT